MDQAPDTDRIIEGISPDTPSQVLERRADLNVTAECPSAALALPVRGAAIRLR